MDYIDISIVSPNNLFFLLFDKFLSSCIDLFFSSSKLYVQCIRVFYHARIVYNKMINFAFFCLQPLEILFTIILINEES